MKKAKVLIPALVIALLIVVGTTSLLLVENSSEAAEMGCCQIGSDCMYTLQRECSGFWYSMRRCAAPCPTNRFKRSCCVEVD